MKSGLLAFGALIWAAPIFAQPSPDPLAPLPVAQPPQQQSAPMPAPAPQLRRHRATRHRGAVGAAAISRRPARAVVKEVAAPKDWRGVFDAIDAGQWASAQAGIAALPPSILTPVAKAELYTAKGSPVVDLASLQALIAQAPELPEADQLARWR